ncbi:MAG: DinB family protein [Balneolaceae bacterium]|nr:DinB family protein [Balneolaceae bacterium]
MMRKITLLLIVSFCSVSALAQLSEGERNFASSYLLASQQYIIDAVSELDEQAFNWKPADGGWSVANCLEHILSTEMAFHGMVQGAVSSNEPDNEFNNSMADGVLIGNFNNRGTAVRTSENFEPSGKWNTKTEMLAALEESRSKLVEYLNSTDHDLRHYKMALPVATVDAYQIYLLVAAHGQRHTNQMLEVLAEMESM